MRLVLALALAPSAVAAPLEGGPITGLAADAAGGTLATASEEGTVRLWTASDGRQRLVLRLPPLRPGVRGTPRAVAFSPDGATFVYGGLVGEHRPRTVDGHRVYDYLLQWHATADGRRLRELPVPAVPDGLGWAPSGAWWWASSSSQADPRPESTRYPWRGLSVFTREASQRLDFPPDTAVFAAVAAADPQDGLMLARRSSGFFMLDHYDAERRLLGSRRFVGDPAALAFAPDGAHVAASTYHGVVRVYATTSLAAVWERSARGPSAPEEPQRLAIAWSSDGGSLYAAGAVMCSAQGCPVRRYDVFGSAAPRDIVVSRHPVTQLASLPGGRIAYAGEGPVLGVLGPQGQVLWHNGDRAPHGGRATDAAAAPASAAPLPSPASSASSAAPSAPSAPFAPSAPSAAPAPAASAAAPASAAQARIAALRDLAQGRHALARYRLIDRQRRSTEGREAERAYGRAIELAREHGLREEERGLQQALADLMVELGEHDTAMDALQAARMGRAPTADDEAALELVQIAKQLDGASGSRRRQPTMVRLLELRRTLPPGALAPRAAVEALLADAYARFDAGLVSALLALRERAWSLHEQAHGPRHGKTLVQGAALARALADAGRPADAAAVWARVETPLVDALGPGHAVVRGVRLERARALDAARQHAAALPLWTDELERARAAHREAPTIDTMLRARRSSEGAAGALLAAGQAAAARDLYAAVLAGRDEIVAMNEAVVMRLRLRLAAAHRAVGAAEAARAQYQAVLDTAARDMSPPGSGRVSLADVMARDAHEGLARLARDADDLPRARQHARRAADLDDHVAGALPPTWGPRDALAAPTEGPAAFMHRFVATFALPDAGSSATIERAFDLVVDRKGQAFGREAGRRARELSLPPAQRRVVREWAEARFRFAAALHARTQAARAPEAADAAPDDATLVQTMEQLERLRAEIDGLVRVREAPDPVRAAAVTAALPQGDALVVYLRVESDAPRYVAFTATRGRPVRLHDLGPAADVERLVEDLQHALRGSADATLVDQLLREAHERLWQPLGPQVHAAPRVLLDPDAELSRVPFVALLDPQGRRVIERQRLAWLTGLSAYASAATPAGATAQPPPSLGLALLADPQFGQQPTAPRALRSTAAEARSVERLAGSARGQRVWTGAQATARALLGVENPRVLHVATHGVHLDRDTFGLDVLGYESLLARSALLLAPERPGEAASRATGLDVSTLDLRATQLVVLSACDSGAGSVLRGQGVFGLSRAFALAGARNLVLALWPVEDDATAALVEDFYRGLADASPADALHDAQLAALARDRAAGRARGVGSWAAFLLQGARPFERLPP